MTTTLYSTWVRVFNNSSTSPADDIANYAGDFAGDFDLEAITTEYKNAIEELLDGSMVLVGDEFIADVADPEIPDNWAELLRYALESDEFRARMDAWFQSNDISGN
jgi:hypothetical protein